MGPWSEETQMRRVDAVRRLLAQDNLSDWARNYWQSVLDRIARDEDRYNARVVTTFNEMRKRAMRDWW